MNVYDFEIPSHVTSREWAVYLIAATSKAHRKKFLYVGKVGDNRAGCNPVISRIGNHFSYNKIHSQLRNKLGLPTTDFTYKVSYATFGVYSERNRSNYRAHINELEKQLNLIVQAELQTLKSDFKLLNPQLGKASKLQVILKQNEIKILNTLVKRLLI